MIKKCDICNELYFVSDIYFLDNGQTICDECILELIKYKLEELERLSSSLFADINNADIIIGDSLKRDINEQFIIIRKSIADINKKLKNED